jgi:hypothetical protein
MTCASDPGDSCADVVVITTGDSFSASIARLLPRRNSSFPGVPSDPLRLTTGTSPSSSDAETAIERGTAGAKLSAAPLGDAPFPAIRRPSNVPVRSSPLSFSVGDAPSSCVLGDGEALGQAEGWRRAVPLPRQDTMRYSTGPFSEGEGGT